MLTVPTNFGARMQACVRFLTTIFLTLLLVVHGWAISRELKATVRLETGANAVALRSSEKMVIEHYEIPLRLVERDVALRIDPAIMQSLVFEKKGERHIRWIINPEDTKWHRDVERFMLSHDVPVERYRYYDGYQTASRSYFIVDPKTGAEFSAKVSTDKTGGAWRDKKQTYEDAWQIRMVTDYVFAAIQKSGKLENIILLDEPAIFGLKEIDQGMVIREYGKLAGSGFYYVPGFSIMHDETGRKIALANGSNDPAKFWNEHYNKPLARAIAEFAALTGMSYDSPHSQNFMVELDMHQRPTGRIVMRDFGDTYLAKPFFNAIGKSDIPNRWELDNVMSDFRISVGILHGNTAPSWLSTRENTNSSGSYDQWGRDFFVEFEKEFAEQTGLTLSKSRTPSRSGLYYSTNYRLDDDLGRRFLKLASEGRQREALFKPKQCLNVFAM